MAGKSKSKESKGASKSGVPGSESVASPGERIIPPPGQMEDAPITTAQASTTRVLSPEELRKKKRQEETDILVRQSSEYGKEYPSPIRTTLNSINRATSEVLSNFFEVILDPEKVLYKYRVTVGNIPKGGEPRPPKKKETKRAMIRSLMDHIASSRPELRWASDFDEIVLTTPEISGHPKIEGTEHLYDHKRTGKPAGTWEDVTSKLKFEKEIRVIDALQYCKGGSSFVAANEVLMMLNIVSWKNIHDDLEVGQVGKKFYPPPASEVPARSGTNLDWFVVEEDAFHGRLGFFTSMRTGCKKVLMNVNPTTSVFFAAVRLDSWLDSNARNPIIPSFRRVAELKGMKVQIKSTEPNVRIIRDIQKGADHRTCKRDPKNEHDVEYTEEMESIENHLRARKRWPEPHPRGLVKLNIGTIQEPQWDEIKIRNVPNYQEMRYVNVGSDQLPNWYPIYQATLRPFQPYKHQVTSEVMVHAAERRPIENQNHILHNALKALGVTGGNPPQWKDDPNLNGCSILGIDDQFVTCTAGTIEPPVITYGNDSSKPHEGKWDNMLKRFIKVKGSYPQMQCIVITTETRGKDGKLKPLEPIFKDGLEKLRKIFFQNGLDFGQALAPLATKAGVPTPPSRDAVITEMTAAMGRLKANGSPDVPVLLVVLPKRDLELYAHVKWWGDCVEGVATICVQMPNLLPRKGKDEADGKTLGNLSLKFNFKLGGTNHYLNNTGAWDKRFNNTMVMGADVTHPKPKSHCPSIAGVVATYSVKPEFSSHYLGSVRLQESRMEHISDMKELVAERVFEWYKSNKYLPENILFYRDGVSESQFDKVKTLEFEAIREGFELAASTTCRKAKPKKVKITLLVVGKRHHTRFYPKHGPGHTNCPEGTVVDSDIVDPNQFSFYLQSHFSKLGTARSAHYFVMRNEMKLNSEELQNFTMNLCYMTSKSVTALSICPPAKYADVLCERARCYMRSALLDQDGFSHHDSENSYQQDLALYRADKRTWSTAHNQGNGRMNPWSPKLDNIMFYL